MGKWTGLKNGARLIEVSVVTWPNNQVICSCCGWPAPLYYWLNVRRFEFIPLWVCRVLQVYVITRNAYDFRTYRGAEISLYHALGNLPTPPMTHRFC